MLLTAALGVAAALAWGAASRAPDPVAAAERALAAGRPWHAWQLLAPLLGGAAAGPQPEVLLLAARAAAGWQGWTTVTRLLADQPWLDTHAEGLGRALLARAALERGQADASVHALRAAHLAPDGTERGRRLVVLARSLEQAEQWDGAADSYQHATQALPLVADWLLLRAASTLTDSRARDRLYARVTLPAAAARVRWTEALARERSGDFRGAAGVYTELGATLAAFRARNAGARTEAERQGLRQDLLAALPTLPASDVAAAVALLDRLGPLTAAADLAVARRAAEAGLDQRAVAGFARAASGGLLTDADRLARGKALARLGRHSEAMVQFQHVRGPLRAEAQYHRARSLFRTESAERARAALRMVRDSFPDAPETAATAGWLYADALADAGEDAAARLEFAAVAHRHPTTPHGQRAAFQAALLTYLAGDHPAAARAFDAIADQQPQSSETTAALYWSGRAWEAAGDPLQARARYRALVENHPRSYYVVPAAQRLGRPPWPPTTTTPPPPATPLPEPLLRAALLDSLGLAAEASWELDAFSRQTSETPFTLLETATAFHASGHLARAIRLALRAQALGTEDHPALSALLFPLPARELIETEARAASLEPALVAGIVRQESLFDPRARSRADARGLMQVLPSTGATLARAEGVPEWHPALLYQPDLNLRLGLRHLARTLERCGGNIAVALAAYNAGPTPVNRWLTRAGSADPEIFIERIPYPETRDYVRRVLYTAARYRSLYGGR